MAKHTTTSLRWFAPAGIVAYALYLGQDCNACEVATDLLMVLIGGVFAAGVVHALRAIRAEWADRADGLTTQQLLDSEL